MRIWKNSTNLTASQYFSDEMEDGIQECDFWLLSKEMCQLEDLHHQGNQYFLISSVLDRSRTGMGGSSSLSRGWTKGFYVTEDKFTDLLRVGVASKKLRDYLERIFPFSSFFSSIIV